jgi:DNA-binding MarR family transcriptional regulator
MRQVRIAKRSRLDAAPLGEPSERRLRGKPDPLSDLFLAVQRTADRLMQGLEDALRATGITPVQYLVMRSLRQAGAEGMPSNQIARNMTTHDPDLTRLLDKLEEREIIARRRDREDRRIYRVKLTRQGARVLRELTLRTRELHRQQFSRVNKRNIATLMNLLEDVNEAPLPYWDKRD